MIFYKHIVLDEFYTLNGSNYQNGTRDGAPQAEQQCVKIAPNSTNPHQSFSAIFTENHLTIYGKHFWKFLYLVCTELHSQPSLKLRRRQHKSISIKKSTINEIKKLKETFIVYWPHLVTHCFT